MKKIIFILIIAVFNLESSDLLRLSGLEGEIQSLKKQIKAKGGTPQDYYPNADYINSHYPNASAEKKAKLIEKYSIADSKSGIFVGVTGGYGTLLNNYVDGNYNETSTTIPDLKAQRTGVLNPVLNIQSSLWMFGGRLGYQSFFNPYFGARIYGDVLIGLGDVQKDSGEKIGSVTYMLGALNFDLLAEYPIGKKQKHFIGAYLGMSVGTMLLLDSANQDAIKDNSITKGDYRSDSILWNTLLQVDYGINTGISLTINRHNRLEIGAKIPITYLRLGLESPATYTNINDEDDKKTLESKDIEFKRSVIWTASYIYLF